MAGELLMTPELVEDRGELERWLLRNPTLHVYELGDLDDFFWPDSKFYGDRVGGQIEHLVLLYGGTGIPTVLALCEPDRVEGTWRLLEALIDLLPDRLYSHLTEGLSGRLRERCRMESHGLHLKMSLTDPSRLGQVDTGGCEALGLEHRSELEELFRIAYPDNWFVPRMLETEYYVGIRVDGRLVCVAGVHVCSKRYGTAALGNVTTLPEMRGRGLATRACAALCRSLLRAVDHIGLNVQADNTAAIRCYERLGFTTTARYEEWMMNRR